jgi:hypothetical protein
VAVSAVKIDPAPLGAVFPLIGDGGEVIGFRVNSLPKSNRKQGFFGRFWLIMTPKQTELSRS